MLIPSKTREDTMTLMQVLRRAVETAKKNVLDNLDLAAEQIGTVNPFGDKTLLLDQRAEDIIVKVLRESGMQFDIMTEEQGVIKAEGTPEFLAIVDPIDGSANLEREIPLCSIGISVIPFSNTMTTDEVTLSIIDSIFTDETYVATKGQGVRKNGKSVRPREGTSLENAIISYDTKRKWEGQFAEASCRTLTSVYDMRRSASNLLDLCWTAAGSLDAMVDLRDMLPIVHVCGTHMVLEAGGVVLNKNGSHFTVPIDMNSKMSFVAASTSELAKEILTAFKGVTF
ncbi:MAG: inositol monophosphatase family protein [Candidatus Thorarchaeota archaeon]